MVFLLLCLNFWTVFLPLLEHFLAAVCYFSSCLAKSIRVHFTKGAMHTTAALELTGVYIVIFSFFHTHGYKLQQAKGQQGFPSFKTKKLTLKWSVTKWKDKTAKSSP